jgi:hypothetical protein
MHSDLGSDLLAVRAAAAAADKWSAVPGRSIIKLKSGPATRCARDATVGEHQVRHNLKIDDKWLTPVASGQKKAEIRRADRNFSEGDELLLYTPDKSTGEIVVITHVLPLDEVPGYKGGPFVSLSIEPLRRLSGDAVVEELNKGSFG